jgi:hypothetical protein
MSISNLQNPPSIKTDQEGFQIISENVPHPLKTIDLSAENVIGMGEGSFKLNVEPLKAIDLSKSLNVNVLSKVALKKDDDIADLEQHQFNIISTEKSKSSLVSKAFNSLVSLVGKIGEGISSIPVPACRFLASIPGKVRFALLEQEKQEVVDRYKEINKKTVSIGNRQVAKVNESNLSKLLASNTAKGLSTALNLEKEWIGDKRKDVEEITKSLDNRQVNKEDGEKLSTIGKKLDTLKKTMETLKVSYKSDDQKGLEQNAIIQAEVMRSEFENIKKELEGIRDRSKEIDVEVISLKDWGDFKIDASDIKQKKPSSKLKQKDPTEEELILKKPNEEELELEYVDPHKSLLKT